MKAQAMDLRRIARLLGGEVAGRGQILCPGPGHTRPDRSLSVTFVGADEPIVHSFAGDDWRACKDHVARLLGLPGWRPSQDFEERRRRQEAKRALRAKTEAETEAEARNTRVARLIWHRGVDPRGTAAELYLKSRGLALTDDACAVLRFHPAATWRVDPDHPEFPPGRHPTLLAAFQDIETDELTGIHRLRVDRPRLWPRTRRKMLGPVAGSAVKLADVPDGVLAVGEGIETAMAANQMGFGPAWALGSAGAIAALPVLEGIRKLLLLCENDGASRTATEQCAQRWLRAGREVELAEPEVGKDLNDELMGSR
jgi:putative DNA primase/helicase